MIHQGGGNLKKRMTSKERQVRQVKLSQAFDHPSHRVRIIKKRGKVRSQLFINVVRTSTAEPAEPVINVTHY